MVSAQNNDQNQAPSAAPQQQAPVITAPISVATGSKEHEAKPVGQIEAVTEVAPEIELSKEVKEAGVTKLEGQTIELPPDVKKLGVTPIGSPAPVVSPLPEVTLPISDSQVAAGFSEPITDSFRWLVVWCMKKLQKAHLALKMVHGKITRVKI